MVLDPDTLSQDKLFVAVPAPEDISLQQFQQLLHTEKDYGVLISKSYQLLKLPLTIADKLKAWEIRLTLQLFGNKLAQAKQEAINLNNVLYLEENNNIPPSTNSGGVFPLPRNNNGLIHHRLLVLLLRLKSAPNMNLINEFYKLCYQLRLRSSASPELTKNLLNLSFDTVVILLINRHYPTLLNFLNSMIYEIKPNTLQDYNHLLDNIRLLRIVTKVLLLQSIQSHSSTQNVVRQIVTEHQQEFEEIQSIDSNANSSGCIAHLVYVLNHIPPTVHSVSKSGTPSPSASHSLPEPESDSPGLQLDETELTLSKLVELIMSGQVSARTLYSTIGIWDLTNEFEFVLKDGQLQPGLLHSEGVSVGQCLDLVSLQWCNHFNKVYGLE